MNIPVAPQAARRWRLRCALVSVVSISMSRDRECCDGIAAIMYFLGSDRSQARIRLRRAAGIGGVCTSFTQSEVEIEGSIMCSISNTSKGLCDCSEGVRFTRCDIENPPPPFLRLVRAPRRLHPFMPTALGSRPPVRPHTCVGCRTGGGIPASNGQVCRSDGTMEVGYVRV